MMTRLCTPGALAALALVPATATAQGSANPFTDAVKAQLAQMLACAIMDRRLIHVSHASSSLLHTLRQGGPSRGHLLPELRAGGGAPRKPGRDDAPRR